MVRRRKDKADGKSLVGGAKAAFGAAAKFSGDAAKTVSFRARSLAGGTAKNAGALRVKLTPIIATAVAAAGPAILDAIRASGGSIHDFFEDKDRLKDMAGKLYDFVPGPQKLFVPRALFVAVVGVSGFLIVKMLTDLAAKRDAVETPLLTGPEGAAVMDGSPNAEV